MDCWFTEEVPIFLEKIFALYFPLFFRTGKHLNKLIKSATKEMIKSELIIPFESPMLALKHEDIE